MPTHRQPSLFSSSHVSARTRAARAENPASPSATGAVEFATDGSALPLPIGARLGDFAVAGVIHHGKSGFVYVGSDSSSPTRIAVKEYFPGRLADRMGDGNVGVRSLRYQHSFRDGMKGFLSQSRMLAALDEPALVRVLRIWEQHGTAYAAMPLYEGRSLESELHDARPSEAWLKAMLGSLLDALATLHRLGCYPCDVTPRNVLVSDGGPLLFDVGMVRRILARNDQGGTSVLDRGYAAIEQYSQDPAMPEGPWTDVYAVASVLRLAITGKPPPEAVTRVDSDTMQPSREVAKGYSESFLDGIDRGLAIRPRDRPQSIEEFREALSVRSLESNAIAVHPPTQPPPSAASSPPPHAHELRQPAAAEETPTPVRAFDQGRTFPLGTEETLPPSLAHDESLASPPVPDPIHLLRTATVGRLRVVPWKQGASLIAVALAGLALLWTLGGRDRPTKAVDTVASTKPALTREEPSPPAAAPVSGTLESAPSDTAAASPAAPEVAAAAPASTPARGLSTSKTKPKTAAKSPATAARTGKIQFAIKPWGEIVVDGKKRGVSPPIKELSVPEGRHRIEIRNGTFSGYKGEVDIKAGRSVAIAHSFTSP